MVGKLRPLWQQANPAKPGKDWESQNASKFGQKGFVINQGEKLVNKERDQLSERRRVYLMLLNGRLNCLGELQFNKKEKSNMDN